MCLEEKLKNVFYEVSKYLNQNDLINLGMTNRKIFREIAVPRLYRNIIIRKNFTLRSEAWYLDAGVSYIGGYKAVIKSDDQNDLFLYDKLERLLESANLDYIKSLVIQSDVFQDRSAGIKILQMLVDRIISIGTVTNFEIYDVELFYKNYSRILKMPMLENVCVVGLEDFNRIAETAKNVIKAANLVMVSTTQDSSTFSPQVEKPLFAELLELNIEDPQASGLRFFFYCCSQNIVFEKLVSLRLCHVHSVNNYNQANHELHFRDLEKVIHIGKLRRFEFEFSCEVKNCDCADSFLMGMAKKLTSLNELGLIERVFIDSWNHTTSEKWDLWISKFILHLPNVGSNLKKLSIRHSIPTNGLIMDAVEGNYNRRRSLYEHVLPNLKSLEILIVPTMLQSLSAYEVLVCDLLWNGCECAFCKKVMNIYDDYIINHQYLSDQDGTLKDIVPTVFFAYVGDSISRRILYQASWDIKLLNIAPSSYFWNMHGYNHISHFAEYECLYDESAFPYLGKIISHFFNTYMEHLVRFLPNLRTCILSGVYYQCYQGSYKCIYD